MSDFQCSICRGQLKEPVVISCGHVFCKTCLYNHISHGKDILRSNCPLCRKDFPSVPPVLETVPEKLRPFISNPITPLFIALPPSSSAQAQRIAHLTRENELLLDRAERNLHSAHVHQQGEKDARVEVAFLKNELKRVKEQQKEEMKRMKAKCKDYEIENAALKRASAAVMAIASSQRVSSSPVKAHDRQELSGLLASSSPSKQPLSSPIKLASPFLLKTVSRDRSAARESSTRSFLGPRKRADSNIVDSGDEDGSDPTGPPVFRKRPRTSASSSRLSQVSVLSRGHGQGHTDGKGKTREVS